MRKFLISIAALTGIVLFFTACQSQKLPEVPAGSGVPFSKGPTSPPGSLKGPSAPPPDVLQNPGVLKNATDDSRTKTDVKTDTKIAAKWLAYKIKPLRISFNYPASWGEIKLEKNKGDSGDETQIIFSNTTLGMYYHSTDFAVGRDGMFEDFAPKSLSGCDELKKYNPFQLSEGGFYTEIDHCQKLAGGAKGALLFHFPASDGGIASTGDHWSGLAYTGNSRYPYLVLIAESESGVTAETMQKVLESFK